jgi:error-prone DNA polymerase
MSAYAELAVTTNFSFLRGASTAEELVLRAKELGLIGIGVADRNSVAGVVRAHAMAKTIGLKIAVGARLVFSDGSPDILAYPQDRAAWGRLTYLLTIGKDRAEKGDCLLGLIDLLERIEGLNLIVMPPQRIDSDALIQVLRRLKETSRRSVWLAGSLLYRGDDRRRLVKLRDIADAALVPLIAVNDVLYHAPERRVLQDVVTCIREHRTLEEAGRLLEANAERHLKSADEMMRLFGAASKAVEQTTRFFKRCRFSLDELKPQYPSEFRKDRTRGACRVDKSGCPAPLPVGRSAIRLENARQGTGGDQGVGLCGLFSNGPRYRSFRRVEGHSLPGQRLGG